MQRRSLLPSAFGGFTTPSPRHGSDPFLALHREMNRLFDEAFRGFGLLEGGAGSEAITSGVAVPRIDVSETDQDLKVFAELPGVDQNDVEITLSDDVLTIRGDKEVAHENQQQNYHDLPPLWRTPQQARYSPSGGNGWQAVDGCSRMSSRRRLCGWSRSRATQ